jgi:hypothetical protein
MMVTFLDESNKVFYAVIEKRNMGRQMEEINRQFPGDKNIIIINNESYRNENGYANIARKITVDYTTQNLVFFELLT